MKKKLIKIIGLTAALSLLGGCMRVPEGRKSDQIYNTVIPPYPVTNYMDVDGLREGVGITTARERSRGENPSRFYAYAPIE